MKNFNPIFFFVGLCLLTIPAHSQEQLAHRWISASSVNDFMALQFDSDRYYSFGDHIDFLSKKNKDSSNHTNNTYFNARLTLEGHTPQYKNLEKDPSLNRPFFGRLNLNISQMQSSSKRFWKYGFSAGISGPIAGAGDYQNGYHQLFLENEQVQGWDEQTPNKLGLNLELVFKQEIFQQKNHRFYLGSNSSLGNIYTYIAPELSYQFNTSSHPTYLPLRYQQTTAKGFGIEASMAWRYEFHNAALQGEYFSHSENYLSDELIYQSLFFAKLGFRYSIERFGIYLSNTVNSVRVKSNKFHNYGAVGIVYHW